MPPHHAIPVSPGSPIDDQIRYLEDFLKELEPETSPTPVPREEDAQRVADLRAAKSHIDQAIALLRPHFTGTEQG